MLMFNFLIEFGFGVEYRHSIECLQNLAESRELERSILILPDSFCLPIQQAIKNKTRGRSLFFYSLILESYCINIRFCYKGKAQCDYRLDDIKLFYIFNYFSYLTIYEIAMVWIPTSWVCLGKGRRRVLSPKT